MPEEYSSDNVFLNIKKNILFFRASLFLGIIVSAAHLVLSVIYILMAFSQNIFFDKIRFFYYFTQAAIIISMILISLSSRKFASIIPERSQKKMNNFSLIFIFMAILQLISMIFDIILSAFSITQGIFVMISFFLIDVVFLICYGFSLNTLEQKFGFEKESLENKTKKLYSFYGIIAVIAISLILFIVNTLVLGNYSNNIRDCIIGVMYIIMYWEIDSNISKITPEMIDSNYVGKIDAEN